MSEVAANMRKTLQQSDEDKLATVLAKLDTNPDEPFPDQKGGLVIQHHNEIRDAMGDLASIVYKEVIQKPVVQEANNACGVPSMIADLIIRGVWQPQMDVAAILSSAEEEKKRKIVMLQKKQIASSNSLLKNCYQMEKNQIQKEQDGYEPGYLCHFEGHKFMPMGFSNQMEKWSSYQ
ncbi:hypothetical protein EMCRGX_G030117 [Ephydatia muelleri]